MVGRRRLQVAIAGFGVGLAALTAPSAAADPAGPIDPSVPAPVVAPVVAPSDAPAAPSVDLALAAPAQPVVTPPNGMQHLPSPSSLPPGTTQEAPEHPNVGYLRDIWHALRSGEVSGTDALMLLGTRPVNPDKLAASRPSNQGPTGGTDVPAAASDSAPAPAAPAPDAPKPPAAPAAPISPVAAAPGNPSRPAPAAPAPAPPRSTAPAGPAATPAAADPAGDTP